MSDFDSHPDDELVSAYLDGEATALEVARVESDPDLQARVEVFRRVAAAVATPPAPDAAIRDDTMASVLATAPAPREAGKDASPETPAGEAAVLDFRERRARQRKVRIVSIAAAAVIALLVAIPVLRSLGQSDTEQIAATSASGSDDAATAEGLDADSAAGGPEEAQVAEDAGELQPAAPESQAAEGFETESFPRVDLGAFDDRRAASAAITSEVDLVLVRLRETGDARALSPNEYADEAGNVTRLDAAAVPCFDDLARDDLELRGLSWWGGFELNGTTHDVLLFALSGSGAENGTHRLYEVTGGCSIVTEQTIG